MAHLDIILKMHGGNSHKFDMLMYPGHIQYRLDYSNFGMGQIGFLIIFWKMHSRNVIKYGKLMYPDQLPGCPATYFFLFSLLFHLTTNFFLFFSSNFLLVPFLRNAKKKKKCVQQSSEIMGNGCSLHILQCIYISPHVIACA